MLNSPSQISSRPRDALSYNAPGIASDGGQPRKTWPRQIAVLGLALAVLALALLLLFTDPAPLVPKPPPPTAEQVGAARAVAREFRDRRAKGGSVVRLNDEELAAIGVLAGNALAPDRLRIEARDGLVAAMGSHRLPLGRWLNVIIVSRGGGIGFPPAAIMVGSVGFSPPVSRWLFEQARRVAIARGLKLPPLDRVARRVTIADGWVSALVTLPSGSGVVAQLGGADRADPVIVANAYCHLAKLQRANPSDDFATQLRRVFALGRAPGRAAGTNRAALIALAMLTVDRRVGDLANLESAATARCAIDPITTMLNGRADLSKHWALSAALAAATGAQFSQAMGEWKELADSISRQSQFAVGDPSGFSFLDLAADRSGFLTAARAVDAATAERVGDSLAKAQQADLLPPTLMRLSDGISNAAFVRNYGSIDDPRFQVALARIDAELRRSAIARSGPLADLPD